MEQLLYDRPAQCLLGAVLCVFLAFCLSAARPVQFTHSDTPPDGSSASPPVHARSSAYRPESFSSKSRLRPSL